MNRLSHWNPSALRHFFILPQSAAFPMDLRRFFDVEEGAAVHEA